MSHFCKKCKECQKIITQCRCFDPNKTVEWSVCEACQSKVKIEAEDKVAYYEKEILGVLEMIPTEFCVRIREGAGPENLVASLAVSVAKLVIRAQKV